MPFKYYENRKCYSFSLLPFGTQGPHPKRRTRFASNVFLVQISQFTPVWGLESRSSGDAESLVKTFYPAKLPCQRRFDHYS